MANPEKIHAVVAWPMSKTRKELQCFLEFANFYRRFIRDYSKIASPLTRLMSSNVEFCWSPEADLFTSAPLLVQPDPSKQFIIEVDASELCYLILSFLINVCIPAPFSLWLSVPH